MSNYHSNDDDDDDDVMNFHNTTTSEYTKSWQPHFPDWRSPCLRHATAAWPKQARLRKTRRLGPSCLAVMDMVAALWHKCSGGGVLVWSHLEEQAHAKDRVDLTEIYNLFVCPVKVEANFAGLCISMGA